VAKRLDKRAQAVRDFILEVVDDHPHDLVTAVSSRFDTTKQTASYHIQKAVSDKELIQTGKTRRARFYLAPKKTWQKQYSLAGPNAAQSEHDVWEADVLPQLAGLPENALDIWRYCFTEMFNNAIDHSGGSRATVQLKRTTVNVEIAIIDNGVGIFKKIQQAMKFPDVRYSALELHKGKFTTDPAHHTGEGIFFTSKVLDAFDISSGGVYFTSPSSSAGALEANISAAASVSALLSPTTKKSSTSTTTSTTARKGAGTAFWMKLKNTTTRSLREVFDQFASPEGDYKFDKTIVPVKLAEQNRNDLVSRSQAKRLLLRIDRFRTVILDFKNVNQIGQAFADEIFRVFVRSHPGVDLQFVNANEEVTRMIKRAQST
jgi:anti-sigma regulatory factor (Ser/Thr protein kinase)